MPKFFWEKMVRPADFGQAMKLGKKRFFPEFILFSNIAEQMIEIKAESKMKKNSEDIRENNTFTESMVDPTLKLGIIASKKVGGAVSRNRCKRRVREIVRNILLTHNINLLKKNSHRPQRNITSSYGNNSLYTTNLNTISAGVCKKNDTVKKFLLIVIVVRRDMLLADHQTLLDNLKIAINQQIVSVRRR